MNNELSTDIPLGFNLPKDKTENIIKVIGVGGGKQLTPFPNRTNTVPERS